LATILFWPNNRFDCRSFAEYFLLYRLYQISRGRHYLILQKVTKRTSTDLDRLYKMALLHRTRCKRIAVTRRGVRNRGFKYEYRISKQGWQYFLDLLGQMHITELQTVTSERSNKFTIPGDPLLETIFKKRVQISGDEELQGWQIQSVPESYGCKVTCHTHRIARKVWTRAGKDRQVHGSLRAFTSMARRGHPS